MFNEKTLSLLAACAVTAGGLAIAAPAVGKERPVVVTAPSEDIPTRYVSYRDLNLATPLGEKALFNRVGYAVKDVCIESTGRDAHFYIEMGCRKFAWSGARPQISQAVQRARELAQFGTSSSPAVAIAIAVPGN
jgi:UrcA family protein